MTVSRRKGAAGKADMLFSRIVRSRGKCERCGDRPQSYDTAHIVKRRYSATRCVEDNAWCLCRSCHVAVDGDAAEFMDLVEATIGRDRYQELRRQAHASFEGSSKAFWTAECARLMARCDELGIDKRWRPR